MAKFAINASGAMLLPSLVQVSEAISGSVVPLAMFSHFHTTLLLKVFRVVVFGSVSFWWYHPMVLADSGGGGVRDFGENDRSAKSWLRRAAFGGNSLPD